MSDIDRQSMMEVFTFEMSQMLEQLEQVVIEAENGYTMDQINEIFRIMHTIKGSAAMMLFGNISTAAHSIEDLFYYLREKSPENVDYSRLTDYVLESMDFLKDELTKIQEGGESDGDPSDVCNKIVSFLIELKGVNESVKDITPPTAGIVTGPLETALDRAFINEDNLRVYKAKITFVDGCEMENVRAYTIVYNLKNQVHDVTYEPENLTDESSIEVIRSKGFFIEITTDKDYDSIMNMLSATIYAKDILLDEETADARYGQAPVQEKTSGVSASPAAQPEKAPETPVRSAAAAEPVKKPAAEVPDAEQHTDAGNHPATKKSPVQSMISVSVSKLDNLLKLVGELVITEAMVTQNPDLEGLSLENFTKEARQLKKIIQDLQDTIMSTRMLTLSPTFFKMNRIVRDMCKQLNKEVNLEIIGEDTEVDKNIIEHISDPIMHIVRNAIDHGIESPEERRAKGKPERGTVTLEAKSIGNDVVISISDDGAGLDKDKILARASNNGLLRKAASEYSEKETYQFIFLPGFSTNESVTSYSGRGVGMDVVTKNMESVQGTTVVDSVPGEGSTFTMKIPLTLAIIKGMTIKMGGEKYTVPIEYISKSFPPKKKDMFTDPNGNEMITVYGEHLNVVKLYEFFEMPEAARDVEDGIMMIVENGDEKVCLFIDELVEEQSVVVKNLPKYIGKIHGLSGCTLLGNGDISLIIETSAFFDM